MRATTRVDDDDGGEDEEDRARAVETELARVERAEGVEPCEAEHGEGEDETRLDRRGMDERPARTAASPRTAPSPAA